MPGVVKRQRIVAQLFHREIERQCRNALIASHELEQALDPIDKDRVWYSLHGLLAAAANVSKLLWPDPKRGRRRGHKYKPIQGRERLRAQLSVPDDSPLRGRVLRDDFEHFDERLEEWAATLKKGAFADEIIGPPDMVRGIKEEDRHRWYNPENRTAHFRKEEYPLEPLIGAIWELWPKAAAASKPGTQLKPPPRPTWIQNG